MLHIKGVRIRGRIMKFGIERVSNNFPCKEDVQHEYINAGCK